MMRSRDPSRTLQIGFLALLVVSTAQVAWWIADQVQLARQDRGHMETLYHAEADAVAAIAERLAASSAAQGPPLPAVLEALRERLTHLAIDSEGEATVRPEAVAALVAAADSRINRYAWEGAFFLLVLLGGMIVLTRAIRHDAQLRQRQQNFLATVSHEFKSPLASMRLSAETLTLRAADADSRRLGQRLLQDGERLLNMVDNLLDAARIEEGELELRGEPVPLASVAESACARLADEARAQGIEIRCEVADDLHVHGDRAVVETVLRNLLDNALKACGSGAGTRIAVRATAAEDGVALAIADDGAGFPPEDANAIFRKFYQASPRTSGTGLGLYIVERLTALSGARVAAASPGAGRGATFTLHWPAA